MKKLLTISTMALILSGATSCEKQTPAGPAAMTMETTITFTPTGATKPTVVNGDVEAGERGITYSIAPKLNVCNCNGKWTYKVANMNNNQHGSTQHQQTGTVSFSTIVSGDYKITITYSCPDGASVSRTVTITIK